MNENQRTINLTISEIRNILDDIITSPAEIESAITALIESDNDHRATGPNGARYEILSLLDKYSEMPTNNIATIMQRSTKNLHNSLQLARKVGFIQRVGTEENPSGPDYTLWAITERGMTELQRLNKKKG